MVTCRVMRRFLWNELPGRRWRWLWAKTTTLCTLKIAGWCKFILGNLATYIIYTYIYMYTYVSYIRGFDQSPNDHDISNEYCNCGVYWYTLNTQFRCWGSADVVYGGCGLAGVIIIKMCFARGPDVRKDQLRSVKSVDLPDAEASQEQPIEERGSCTCAALEAARRLFWQSCLGHNIFMFNRIAHRAIGINPLMMEFMYSSWSLRISIVGWIITAIIKNHITWITIIWIKYYMLNRIMIIPYH